jgi:hypothetical protein
MKKLTKAQQKRRERLTPAERQALEQMLLMQEVYLLQDVIHRATR